MEKTAKKPLSKLKKTIAGLAIAYGIHVFGTLGIGAYNEHILKRSPAWEEYHRDVVELRSEKLDNLRALYRLNKTKETLEDASKYFSEHSLEDTITSNQERGFNNYYDEEKQRLQAKIERYGEKREEARNELLTNPESQKYLKHLDTCLTRAFIPFFKPQGDYFTVFGFEE